METLTGEDEPDAKQVLERADELRRKAYSFTQADGRTLVLSKVNSITYVCPLIDFAVSGGGAMRDEVRRVTRNYFTKGFELRELDYQPE